VDLVEVYLPREGVVVTLPYQKDGKDEVPPRGRLRGAGQGPVPHAGLHAVSDNILPVAPAGVWYDLHILGNRIARKLARQAERLKRCSRTRARRRRT
jgi:hypothetical protein